MFIDFALDELHCLSTALMLKPMGTEQEEDAASRAEAKIRAEIISRKSTQKLENEVRHIQKKISKLSLPSEQALEESLV